LFYDRIEVIQGGQKMTAIDQGLTFFYIAIGIFGVGFLLLFFVSRK